MNISKEFNLVREKKLEYFVEEKVSCHEKNDLSMGMFPRDYVKRKHLGVLQSKYPLGMKLADSANLGQSSRDSISLSYVKSGAFPQSYQ